MSEITPDDLNKVAQWHYAVGGLQTQTDTIEIAPAIRLQALKVFPTDVELKHGLNNPLVAGIIQHYGEEVVGHELVIDAERFDEPQRIPVTAGAILAAIRIRTEAEIICPATCDTSWSDLRGAKAEGCIACRVEQAMYAHDFGEPTQVTPDDLEWVRDNLESLIILLDDTRFNTALEALCTYMHAANYRMMAAQLWAGVEALFEAQTEIRFRLALLAALFLKPRGPECKALRKHVMNLYKDRSSAIHGRDIGEEKLKSHVNDVRALLAQLLAKIIQEKHVPTKDDFEDLAVLDSPENARIDSEAGG